LPASAPIRLDAPVLLFTLVIASATGIVFSFAPLFSGTRLDLGEALKAGGRGVHGARQRMRSALGTGEVAGAATLLVSAGLLLQSLYRMRQERLGFSPQGLLTFATPIARDHRRSAVELWRFESSLMESIQSIPGVQGVAGINVLPLSGWSNLPT